MLNAQPVTTATRASFALSFFFLSACGAASSVGPISAASAPTAAVETPEARAARIAQLSPEAYRVTQQAETEPPFRNAYWNNQTAGIYVDVVSGEAVFSSKEKFDSGTGWPSFYAPLERENVRTRRARAAVEERAEVRSAHGDSHLGHVFDDGPQPTGLRYSINSAALRFIPADRLTIEGYGQYARLFPEVVQAR